MRDAAFTPEQEDRLGAYDRQASQRFRLTALFYAACVALHGTLGLWVLSDGNPAALCWCIPCAGTGIIGAVEARRLAREYREGRAWRESMLALKAQTAAWGGGASRP